MACSNPRYCLRFAVDLTLLLFVGFINLMIYLFVDPFERGFFCDDEKLRLPYKDNTISIAVVAVVGIILNIASMCLIEYLRTRRETVGKELQIFGKKFSPWFWSMYAAAGVFLFGCACTQLSTDIAKRTLGVLRPNFIDVCKPDWSQTNCSANSMAYVYPIPCTTDNLDKLNDARQSFPSGHAAFSTFTMIYLVIYIQARLVIQEFKLIKPVLQLVCLLLNIFTCLSRISDYKHHWSDVLGGYILGATIAILTAFYVSDLFVQKNSTISKNTVVMLQDYHQTTTDEPRTNSHNP
ncbi:Phospholipid phosphatase 3 [Armadillidium vulgare]|nr:Phospholipid phosphatase 3 [Armadillidium vulgare]